MFTWCSADKGVLSFGPVKGPLLLEEVLRGGVIRCRPFQCDRAGNWRTPLAPLRQGCQGPPMREGRQRKKEVPHEMPARHGVNTTTRPEIACTFDVGHATMLVLHQGHSTSSSSHSAEESLPCSSSCGIPDIRRQRSARKNLEDMGVE